MDELYYEYFCNDRRISDEEDEFSQYAHVTLEDDYVDTDNIYNDSDDDSEDSEDSDDDD